MKFKPIILYSVIFALVGGVSATAAYLFAPPQTIPAEQINDDNDDEITGYTPKELTPRDLFLTNLQTMKVVVGSATISASYESHNVSLDASKILVYLPSLDNVSLSLESTLTYNGETTNFDVSYVDNVIYASALGMKVKLETSNISRISEIISSFGVEMSLPEEFENLNLSYLMEKLGYMPYEKTESGYKFDFELLEGVTISFLSDENYNLTGLSGNINFKGASIVVDANISCSYETSEEPLVIAPADTLSYNNVSDLFPLAEEISKLVKEEKFALSLSGLIKEDGQEKGTTFTGSTQFNVIEKKGLAKLHLTELEYETVYEHDVALDITTDDVIFNYNDVIKGKIAYASIQDIVSSIKSLIGNFKEVDMSKTIDAAVLLNGTILQDVLNGEYQKLLNNVIYDLTVTSDSLSFSINKDFLGVLNDIKISLKFDGDKLLEISINGLAVKGIAIDLVAKLETFDDFYSVNINRYDLTTYSDYSNFITLANGLNKLIAQEKKQYAINFNGSLTSEEKPNGVSFNGKTRFDVDDSNPSKQSGDGEVTFTENESTYEVKPTHNVKINVDGTDALFEYNNNLRGKFTVQTLRDMFSVVFDLIEDENSRIYQWFGETIDNMNSTILMRIVNGEYSLLVHNIIKELTLDDKEFSLVVSGDILNFNTDIDIKIGFDGENIKYLKLTNFEALDYKLNLYAELANYEESGTTLTLASDTVKYYDFSELKVLASLGINVANLDYFHINGKLSCPISFIGIDLSLIASGLKNMPIDIKIFENNGSIEIMGEITNIPQVSLLNGGNILCHKKKANFYYKNKTVYIQRTDNADAIGTLAKQKTSSVKTSLDDFMDNIIDYILGFGLGLKEGNFWSSINTSISKKNERTSAMKYEELITNYAYSNGTFDYGEHKWDIGLNVAEIANNTDLKSLNLNLYGKKSNFYEVDENTGENVYKDYLSHLDLAMSVDTGSLSVDIGANLDLLDINPNITYNDFTTSSVTKDYYASLLSYISSHASDSALS